MSLINTFTISLSFFGLNFETADDAKNRITFNWNLIFLSATRATLCSPVSFHVSHRLSIFRAFADSVSLNAERSISAAEADKNGRPAEKSERDTNNNKRINVLFFASDCLLPMLQHTLIHVLCQRRRLSHVSICSEADIQSFSASFSFILRLSISFAAHFASPYSAPVQIYAVARAHVAF